ncbi:MAG: hypothetical protein F6K40_29355 [Okeania sp. SIO3I5]|uniref:hypothetical protein n=1 Tax=Okeania sp. SIO3I5 TaxID=2607805 RepID=UPI0013BCD5D0|nr:hypothetical protein [Okeania sp. SIO3I5]NEQ40127.1 hypothetical protein [Okeania sp. SIO3I5]
MKIPLPTFKPLTITEDSPPWVKALEQCRQEQEFLDASDAETAEDLHNDLIAENYGYIKFGIKLGKIIKNQLYRGCKNFQEYFLKFFRQSDGYGRRQIRAAHVSWLLLENGFSILPACISQAAQLAKILGIDRRKPRPDDVKLLVEKWGQILAASKVADAPITTNFIVKTLEPLSYQPRNIKMNDPTYDAARELARVHQEKVGVPVNTDDYVSLLLQETFLKYKQENEKQELPVTEEKSSQSSVEVSVKNHQFKFELEEDDWILLGEISQENGVAPESILASLIRRCHRETIKPEAPPPRDNNSQFVASDEMVVAEKRVATQGEATPPPTDNNSQSVASDEMAVAEKRVTALGIEWKLVKHDVCQNIHYLDEAIQIFKQATPYNPVGYFKAVLRNRYQPQPHKKSQSYVDKNIQAREKRGDEWWDELGILLPERDKYLQRRGNIIEFMNGTANSLSQLSQSYHPQEFIKIITNDTGTEQTVQDDYSEWGDRSCSEISKDGGIVDLPIPPPSYESP